MDLNRLVHSDAPVPQLHHKQSGSPTNGYSRSPYEAQEQAHYRSEQQYGRAENGASLYPPSNVSSAGAYGVQQKNLSLSTISPYQAHASSPYPPANGHASRPNSHGHERSPVTPLQGPMIHQANNLSPTSSQHSFTPQSAHHSPMPVIQYGAPPATYPYSSQAPRVSPNTSSYQQNRGYEAQPLGPPPQRKSMEHISASPMSERYMKENRKQSESVSPKTMPRTELSYDSRQNSIREETPHHQVNLQSSQPRITTTANATPERPSMRRSQTMEMSNLLTPSTETPPDLPRPLYKSPGPTMADAQERKKRSLEDASSSLPPAKKEKIAESRRRSQRPIWAMLFPRNPKANATNSANIPRDTSRRAKVPSAKTDRPSQQQQQQQQRQAPPAVDAASINFKKPWLNAMPYDTELMNASTILGAWEKSMRWNTPMPDMLRGLSDWLVFHIMQYDKVVKSAHGSLEIEAKIGSLLDADTYQPVRLPIMNMALIQPSANRHYRFESALEEEDFKVLNEFLNDTVAQSRQQGRQHMGYTRMMEVDSFAHLSSVGEAQIPPDLTKVLPPGRQLKLRSTQDIKSDKITARIVKVPLADIHILNPGGYDCRISMNAELDMTRGGYTFEDLTLPVSAEAPQQPSRHKERLSYRHLASRIDLTKVSVQKMAASYELEVEVDSSLLSKQMDLMTRQQPNAFTDVVSSFLDNATFLMRLSRPQG